MVKAKNLPYYKCNTKGCGNNKSAREIHTFFEKVLASFSLVGNDAIRGFVAKQIMANYIRSIKKRISQRRA